MQPKYCPICHEANRQNADFCFKCNWIISKKGMQQVREADEAAAREAEQTKRELAEVRARQEEASRKQQLDIDQIKAQLEKNTEDQVGILLKALSELQKQEPQAQKNFVLKKLGILTNGKLGVDPETGITVEPLHPEEEIHS
jgi:hypothetical protein